MVSSAGISLVINYCQHSHPGPCSSWLRLWMHYTIDPAPPPWVRSFQDPRDAGPSSAHISDLVFQTQPEVLCYLLFQTHHRGLSKESQSCSCLGTGHVCPVVPCSSSPSREQWWRQQSQSNTALHLSQPCSNGREPPWDRWLWGTKSKHAVSKGCWKDPGLSLVPLPPSSFFPVGNLAWDPGRGWPAPLFYGCFVFFTKLYICGNKNSP